VSESEQYFTSEERDVELQDGRDRQKKKDSCAGTSGLFGVKRALGAETGTLADRWKLREKNCKAEKGGSR